MGATGWEEHLLALLGRRVDVTITDGLDAERVVVSGRLLSFGNSGEFVVEDEGGFVHHAWPLLNIKASE